MDQNLLTSGSTTRSQPSRFKWAAIGAGTMWFVLLPNFVPFVPFV